MTTVGEILAAERRRQGKTMVDVVEGTKIRGRLLDALEAGDYDVLPSPAYVKGYIQSYARYLEIPPEPLLEQYKRETADTARKPTQGRPSYLDGIPAETVVPRRERAHEIPRRVWVIVAAGGVLLLLVLCVIAFTRGGSGGANTTPTTVPGLEASGTSPGATSTATTTVTTAGKGFVLRITIRQGMASSVKVTDNGIAVVDKIMQAGESAEWRVSNQAKVVLGNPQAVEIRRDGTVAAITATAGQSFTIPAAN
jgi:cytoskeleton protein RodZ